MSNVIISSEPEEQKQPEQPADVLFSLQALIERQVERSDQLREKLRALSQSMRSLIENDTELSAVETEAEEVTKKVKGRKKILTESPEYRQLKAKADELKDELKEIEETLNTHLLSYYQTTGVRMIDFSNGNQREFKIVAKVLPKKREKSE